MKSAALPYAAYFYDFLSASMLDAQRAIPAGADAMRRGDVFGFKTHAY